MEHYEEVLKLLQDEFDWKLTDSLTITGKKLVADTIKALKIAENNQALKLQQTSVIVQTEHFYCWVSTVGDQKCNKQCLSCKNDSGK